MPWHQDPGYWARLVRAHDATLTGDQVDRIAARLVAAFSRGSGEPTTCVWHEVARDLQRACFCNMCPPRTLPGRSRIPEKAT